MMWVLDATYGNVEHKAGS